MSCDCHRIGGPFIAEDPDCPVHGREAQARARLEEQQAAEAERRNQTLEQRVEELAAMVRQIRAELDARNQA